MIKTKKQMFIVIGVFALVLFLGGTTFAWFNYSRTTSDQQLIAGEIYLHLNEGTNQISMTNVFPETAEEARARNDNYITFTVDGLNTSNKTIYYEFILDHGDDKASPKTRYRDEDLRFDLVELDAGGNEVNYLLSAVSYETLVNRRIYVDTVNAGTTSEVVRRYKLRMWLDENVVISDTAQDAVYNTTDYKNKYATVKITTAGDFQEKEASRSLYTIMRNENIGIDIDNGVDFSTASNYDGINGEGTKGVYLRKGTENSSYPILYYRGAVENNNVKFANYCWKVVRTTDNGGVKLLYNGEVSTMYEDVNYGRDAYSDTVNNTGEGFNFNTNKNRWETTLIAGGDHATASITFSLKNAGNYTLKYSNPNSGPLTIKRGNTQFNVSSGINTIQFDNVLPSEQFQVAFTNYNSSVVANVYFYFLEETIETGIGCNNSGTSSYISLDIYGTPTSTFQYNNFCNSNASFGYMYGQLYEGKTLNLSTNVKYGSSFIWDGSNYKLVDATVTRPDSTHHYSCNSTDSNATCTNLMYIYQVQYNSGSYIILSNGKDVEDAIDEMNMNIYDSNAKSKIDTWYSINLTNYTDKFEDAIYCNDRSVYQLNGWSKNGAVDGGGLYYSSYERINSSFIPSLTCSKNDSFSWKNSNGNQKLNYPIALLTSDEMLLMGKTNYNIDGNYYSMTPNRISFSSAVYNAIVGGALNTPSCSENGYGLRPVLTLKSGIQVSSGTGTVTDPYIIE